MKHSDRHQGFTLIELLVVVAVIGILAALVMGLMGSGKKTQRELVTKGQLNSLAGALKAYYSKASYYPDDQNGEAPVIGYTGASNPGESPLRSREAPAGKGYLYVLQNFETRTYENGVWVVNSQSFLPLPDDQLDLSDPEHMYDTWGNPIQYRLMPNNVTDFHNRFDNSSAGQPAAAQRQAFHQFISEGREFHIWSWGDDEVCGQDYPGTLSPDLNGVDSGSSNSSYKSGGVRDGSNDDIGNW